MGLCADAGRLRHMEAWGQVWVAVCVTLGWMEAFVGLWGRGR